MKKYEIVLFYNKSETYIVEAENEEEAENSVMEGNHEPVRIQDYFDFAEVSEIKEKVVVDPIIQNQELIKKVIDFILVDGAELTDGDCLDEIINIVKESNWNNYFTESETHILNLTGQ